MPARTAARTAARPAARGAVLLVACAALTGCASAVTTQPGPQADDPACAEVVVRLPLQVGLTDRREVDAQSAAAWGDPAVVLRCGVTPPGPTTDGCVQVGAVDWVTSTDPESGDSLYTTYGRVPAVEVRVPEQAGSGLDAVAGALAELSPAVERVPQQRSCV